MLINLRQEPTFESTRVMQLEPSKDLTPGIKFLHAVLVSLSPLWVSSPTNLQVFKVIFSSAAGCALMEPSAMPNVLVKAENDKSSMECAFKYCVLIVSSICSWGAKLSYRISASFNILLHSCYEMRKGDMHPSLSN